MPYWSFLPFSEGFLPVLWGIRQWEQSTRHLVSITMFPNFATCLIRKAAKSISFSASLQNSNAVFGLLSQKLR
jgi:hypothetical protein